MSSPSSLLQQSPLHHRNRHHHHHCHYCRNRHIIILLLKDADPSHLTAAIGDGGNDVSMLQEAHVGLAIIGQDDDDADSDHNDDNDVCDDDVLCLQDWREQQLPRLQILLSQSSTF